VVCVSHNDAVAFILWLNEQTGESFRLPSEAEWEYAARAGSNNKYAFGNDSDSLCRYGNVADNKTHPDGDSWSIKAECNDGYVFTAPVGQYQANALGLYDMHGNVWEWTADYSNESYSGAPTDGSAWQRGDSSRRVVRGGSWVSSPRSVRASNRLRAGVTDRYVYYGFRLAQD